jgi:prepilin-type N-terminal cleavage/methylation domain-containing protein
MGTNAKQTDCLKCFGSWQRNVGFTLIELLVVIAIISILAALLFPALRGVKNKSSEATDINNFKQLTITLHLYVDGNNGVLPYPNWDNGGPINGVYESGWLYGINTNASGPDQFDLKSGVFWDAIHDPRIYLCPMDHPGETARPQRLSSYVMNGATVGYFRQLKPLSLARIMPDACVFWEPDEHNLSYFNDGASYPKELVSTRHSRGAIQASFDGSVSYIRLSQWLQYVNDPDRNRLWCFPDSFDGR